MAVDLRCDSKKHAVLIAPGILEIKCDSRFCGAVSGTVVLHQFDFTDPTKVIMHTNKYRNPRKES